MACGASLMIFCYMQRSLDVDFAPALLQWTYFPNGVGETVAAGHVPPLFLQFVKDSARAIVVSFVGDQVCECGWRGCPESASVCMA